MFATGSKDAEATGFASREQAALLRARRFDAADIDNIAEEIESVGRRAAARRRLFGSRSGRRVAVSGSASWTTGSRRPRGR